MVEISPASPKRSTSTGSTAIPNICFRTATARNYTNCARSGEQALRRRRSPDDALQELGHESLAMTQIYLSPVRREDEAKKAVSMPAACRNPDRAGGSFRRRPAEGIQRRTVVPYLDQAHSSRYPQAPRKERPGTTTPRKAFHSWQAVESLVFIRVIPLSS
jgi:hypothetical protein